MTRNLLLKLAVSSIVLGAATSGCSTTGSTAALNPVVVSKPAVAAKSADKAREALAAGKLAKAVALAEAAVANAPQDGGYRALLGQAYLNSGRFQSAETALADAMSLGMNDPKTIISLSLARISQGKSSEAVAFIRTHQDSLPASDAGLALALAGDLESAIYVLTDAARQEGAGARTRQNLALTYALAGRWAPARIISSQDLSPAKLEERMTEWAALAQQSHPAYRVAALLGVKPREDAGMPTRLALNMEAPAVQLAQADADPAPLAQFAPPPPAEPVVVAAAGAPVSVLETIPEPAIRAIELPVPTRAAAQDDAPAGQIILAETRPYRTAPKAAVAAAPVRAAQAEARALTSQLAAKPRVASFDSAKPSGWAIQLGAYDTLGIAKEKWAGLTRSHALLAGYPASSHAATVKGKTFYRLTINGIASKAEAQRMCQKLQASGQICFARQMTGTENIRWASANVPAKPTRLAAR